MNCKLSVIIPVYNRAALLAHPLASLRTAALAAPDTRWELIVVDDGSDENIQQALAAFPDLPVLFHRLPRNSGLLAARLAGLALAQGEFLFFLDADDAVAPGKFTEQLRASAAADVSYGDVARRTIDSAGQPTGELRHDAACPRNGEPAEFYLGIQPAPHNPIFRRSYLQAAVEHALFPPARTYDPIAETWFYYQLSVRPGRIVYVPGAWSVVGEPQGERLSGRWERQAFAALRLMQSFLEHAPRNTDTERARRMVGRCAFATWRGLPHGFDGFPADDFLAIWRAAPSSG
ncbi:MAG TPA: glycosyltransferase family A protein, partial [Opitutus sp.]|nr:glycosyltransferase family A protein [Opitutus sp.]